MTGSLEPVQWTGFEIDFDIDFDFDNVQSDGIVVPGMTIQGVVRFRGEAAR